MRPEINPRALERRIRQVVQGPPQTFWAVCHPGFESVVAQELQEVLGPRPFKTTYGGLEFEGRLEDCWKIHAQCRTPSRISMRIAQFKATQFTELIRKVAQVPWECYLSPYAPGDIQVSSHHSRLIHTDAIEERVAQGIAMRLAQWKDVLDPPKTELLAQTVLVRFDQDECTISLDASGGLLYLRGYDKHTEEAPIRDTLAACILRKANWMQMDTLIDPMSGSGTFSLEAALMRIPQGYPAFCRPFAFMAWPSFRPAAWNHLIKQLNPPHLLSKIHASDLDSKSVETIQRNLQTVAGHLNIMSSILGIETQLADFFTGKAPKYLEGLDRAKTLLVLNPPYGIRLGGGEPRDFKQIGDQLKQQYQGCSYAIVCPSPDHAKALGLAWTKKTPSKTGGLEIDVVFGVV